MANALPEVATSPADHRETFRHLTTTGRCRLGARDFAHDDPNGYLHFDVGSGPTDRRVVVRFTPGDTYRVDVGRIRRINHLSTFVHQGSADDVLVADLATTVERLFRAANGK